MGIGLGDADSEASKGRPGISPVPVLLGLLVSFIFSMAAGLWIYKKWIHYEPRVLGALPQHAAQFAYLDIEQAVVYEPFRRHLLPLLEVGRNSKESRLLAIERKTGIELGVDARELLWYRSGQGGGVLLGGLLRQDRLMPGMQELLLEEGIEAKSLGTLGLGIGDARLTNLSPGVVGIELGVEGLARGPGIALDRLLPPFLGKSEGGQVVLLSRRREPLPGNAQRSLELWIMVSVQDGFRILVSSEATALGPHTHSSSELFQAVNSFLGSSSGEGASCQVLRGQEDLQAGPWVRSCPLSRSALDRIVAALATDVRMVFSLPE